MVYFQKYRITWPALSIYKNNNNKNNKINILSVTTVCLVGTKLNKKNYSRKVKTCALHFNYHN